MKQFITHSTCWLFDESGRYCRIPKEGSGDRAKYRASSRLDDNVWMEHTAIEWVNDPLYTNGGEWKRLWIHTPHAIDNYGVMTGIIIEDGFEDAQWLTEMYPDEDPGPSFIVPMGDRDAS